MAVFDLLTMGEYPRCAIFPRLLRGAAQSTLPLHVAKKKIPCLDAAGALVTPEAPNGVKLEMFIFDSFPVAKKVRTLLHPSRSRPQPADLPPYIPPT